jgi:PAS domain-containing protein
MEQVLLGESVMAVSESWRRWEPVIARIKMRLACKPGQVPPKIQDALEEASATFDTLLQELAATEGDVSELRSRIRTHENEWEYLFRIMPVACLITDRAGTVVRANDRAAQLLNLSARHLADRPLTYFMEDRDAFLRFLGQLAVAAPEARLTVSVRPRERAPLDMDIVVVPQNSDSTDSWLWFLLPTTVEAPRGRSAKSERSLLSSQTLAERRA